MRWIGLFLLTAVMLSGCNADPACRRETALLRAEILDLEDKLALANSYSGGGSYEIASFDSGQEIIISDPLPMYESGSVIEQPGTIQIDQGSTSRAPQLEVQHEIFPDANGSQNSLPSIDSIEAESLRGSELGPTKIDSELETILPDDVDLTPSPAGSGVLPAPSETKNRTKQRRSRQQRQADSEIVLDFADEDDTEGRSTAFITEVIVNRSASRGKDVDGKLGDEGLSLLIQPRAADGSVVLEPGHLVVDLIDLDGQQRKVGHWEFMPSETKLFFATDRREGEGILLHLPWEDDLPRGRQLVASVSFTTSDQRQLQTSSRLRIDPPNRNYSADDPLVAGWTQRDTRWQIGSHNAQSSAGRGRGWRESPDGGMQQQLAAEAKSIDRGPSRRKIKAIPASSSRTIKTERSGWRPVR